MTILRFIILALFAALWLPTGVFAETLEDNAETLSACRQEADRVGVGRDEDAVIEYMLQCMERVAMLRANGAYKKTPSIEPVNEIFDEKSRNRIRK